MKNKEYISLVKMMEYIEKSFKYTEGYSFEQFCEDEKTIDATIFAISQIYIAIKTRYSKHYRTRKNRRLKYMLSKTYTFLDSNFF